MTLPENVERAALEPATAISRWRSEPFRLFFPLGVLFAWIGVGHWLLYATGATATYSCRFHGLVQMQAFMMAFAVGFLLTALPRRTQTPPVGRIEMTALAAALVVTTGAAIIESWILAEIAYATLLVLLIQFAMRRFLARAAGRQPPAAFVLLPIAAIQGLAGAALIAAADANAVLPSSGYLGVLWSSRAYFSALRLASAVWFCRSSAAHLHLQTWAPRLAKPGRRWHMRRPGLRSLQACCLSSLALNEAARCFARW